MLQWIFYIILILLAALVVAMVTSLIYRVHSVKEYNRAIKKSFFSIKKVLVNIVISCFNNGVSMNDESVYSVDYEMMGTP